ncbi:acetyltransferase [Microbacterium sp. OR16]|uniref:acetyltransferase n=1 Tax=Microbacterium sp. OR16 TaxID=3095345 RepID=UPI0039B64A7A
MTEQIVVIGAGGFGRETLDVIEASRAAGANIVLSGVVDASPRAVDLQRLADRNVRFIGDEEALLNEASNETRFVVAIGRPALRRAVTARLLAAGLQTATVIHPKAVVGWGGSIGLGVVVASGVQISTNVTIGDHVHLNPGSIIGHDAELRDYVSVNPGAVVSGNVVVRRETMLGAASVVLQGIVVGAEATVGAGACVTKDVPAGATVVGIPARPMGASS